MQFYYADTQGVTAANQDVEVNFFIPNIQIMPDEIQENDLIEDQVLDIDNDNDVHAEVDAEVHEELQLGFVQLIEPSMNPDLVSRLSPFRNNAYAVRLQANYLAPGTSQSSASIPSIWADFFTSLLVNPSSFHWAKQLLSSSAWAIILEHGKDKIPFALPDKCPTALPLPCLKNLPEPESLIKIHENDTSDTSPSKVAFVEKEKGKEKATIPKEAASPSTPLEKLQQRMNSSSGPC